MNHTLCRYGQISTVITALFLCNAAHADDKELAEKHFKAGLLLQKVQDFDAAALEFELSVKYYTTKNNLYNLANCYKAIHRYGDALQIFKQILDKFASKLSDEMREDINKQITEMNTIVARFQVDANVSGATITVDGKKMGYTPLSIPLVLGPGQHKVTLTCEGYQPISRTVTLNSGEEVHLHLELQPEQEQAQKDANTPEPIASAPAPAVEAPPPAPPSESAANDTDLENTQQPPEQADDAGTTKSVRSSPLLWIGVAGTLIMGGASAGLWPSADSKRDDANAKNATLKTNWSDSLSSERDDAYAATRALNAAAIVTTAATGVFATLIVVGALQRVKSRTESASASLGVTSNGIEVRF